MSKRPEPADVLAMAKVTGVPVDDATASRIVRTIGHAIEGFSSVSGSLPFDLEPSTFVAEQLKDATP